MAQPKIGKKAPNLTLPTDGGGTLKLSDLRGKAVEHDERGNFP